MKTLKKLAMVLSFLSVFILLGFSSLTPDPAPPRDCDQKAQTLAELSSQCFKVFADQAVCAEFFVLLKDMKTSGCLSENDSSPTFPPQ